MVEAVGGWIQSIKRDEMPHWLVILGHSGTGKTHCAKQLWWWILEARPYNPMSANYLPRLIHWPTLVQQQLREQCFGEYHDMMRWPYLILDDIGAERDGTGFATEQLTTLLTQREGHWTVVTSNLMVDQWSKIDHRIADRLIRGGNRVVEVTAKSYSQR